MRGRFVLLALVLLALLAASSASAAATVATRSLSPAAKTVTACVQQQRRLLVDFDIDRSGSLKSSDPDDRRVDGISAALIGLEGQTEAGGKGPAVRVEVRLSSFAGDVAPKQAGAAWQVLDETSLDNLLRQADHYGSRDNGRDTDYVTALASARRSLDLRAETIADRSGQEPCKVVVFLSDGRFEIGDRSGSGLPHRVFYARRFDLYTPGGGPSAVEAGERYLCRPAGLMDRMVGDGIVKFTVALSASEEFTRAGRGFLKSLTTGQGGGEQCGAHLSPRTGEFVEAQDSRELLFVLGSIGGPSDRFCLVGQCPNPNQFTTIPGLRGFKLTASTLPGVELALAGPAGEAVTFSSGGKQVSSLSGASIRQHWIRDRSLSIEADFDPASREWLGDWRFRFFVPAEESAPVPIYSFSLESDLVPRIVGAPSLIEGRKAKLELELVDHAGVPVTSGPLVDAARLQAQVVDGSGASRKVTVRRSGAGRFELPVRVPEEAPAGHWALSVETGFPTGGAPIEPNFVSLSLPTPTPPHRPSSIWPLVLLVLGLIAVGLVLVYLWQRAQAKFVSPQRLRAFTREAVIEPAGEVSLDPDPGRPEYQDFKALTSSEVGPTDRQIRRGHFVLRSRHRWRGRPYGEAGAPGHELIGGDADGPLPSLKANTRCRVPLDPAGTWLFAIESIDADERVRGQLVVFTTEGESSLGPETLEAARAALASQDWSGFTRGVQGADLGPEAMDFDDDGWDTILR